MSEANASALHGPYRRKVTLACESCRKRRVKCSGTQPCAFCSESGRQCAFDSKNRGRRGPRPRQSANQAPKVTHQLAPRRPSKESTTAHYAETVIEVAIEPTIEVQIPTETVWIPPSLSNLEELDQVDKSDDENDAGREDGLDSEAWKAALEQLLSPEQTELDVDLTIHLIELFCARTVTQFKSLLLPSQINDGIVQKMISPSLLFAICASSMRFSVHPAARRPHSKGLASKLSESARRGVYAATGQNEEIDNIRTLCILIDFEASRGCGRSAWVDIAFAQSLVQLARSKTETGEGTRDALDSAERYLVIAEMAHSIGHLSLQPRCAQKTRRPRVNKFTSISDGTQSLLDVLNILIRINQLCSTPFQQHHPAPWTTESEFRALQDELEEHLLRDPSIFRIGRQKPPDENVDDDVDDLMASLMWHCCAIVLNRTFLPIPERSRSTTESHAPLLRCVDFPDAPPLFLKERAHRCEASANAICDIVQDIISRGGFFSYTLLLGYSCMQSALVLINRLHRSSKPYNQQVVENLKLIFVILGAVRTFYSPAQAWIDVLFKAHDINTPLRHASGDVNIAFESYFSRFIDVEEPAFVPLHPAEAQDGSDTASSQPKTPRNEGSQIGDKGAELGTTKESAGWLQTYVSHLSGDFQEDEDVNGSGSLPGSHEPSLVAASVTDAEPKGSSLREVDGTHPSAQVTDIAVMSNGLTSCAGPSDLINGDLHGRNPLPEEVDDFYPELFSQIPSLGDFIGMGYEIPVFPGLGQLMDGEDIWSDALNNGTSML
ncbi:hypothetical protein B0T10DRAFT_71539 [Thelonectria olida]|uniref:Zn(2)-C6 fungal-type domain-containing protein n=1 Tax=Thelonectria olida TaxID=1576542 RepID=A0A9P8W2F4_9HYPO|nr:hypothetical protein B0T10DRAFT_71539 [Thelonectria olida]